jgi:hypothetical protein
MIQKIVNLATTVAADPRTPRRRQNYRDTTLHHHSLHYPAMLPSEYEISSLGQTAGPLEFIAGCARLSRVSAIGTRG